MNFQGEYEIIPSTTQASITRYVEHGIKPGGFLTAVLSNDLYNATGRADQQNLVALPAIVRWFANHCPGLYGEKNMREHIRFHCGEEMSPQNATAVEMEKNLTEPESTTIQWTEEDRVQLFFIIERAEQEHHRLDTSQSPDAASIMAAQIDPVWFGLKNLGIKWAELDDEVNDAPPGTIAVWEGPGYQNEDRKQCWIIPDDIALKLIALDPDPRRVPRD